MLQKAHLFGKCSAFHTYLFPENPVNAITVFHVTKKWTIPSFATNSELSTILKISANFARSLFMLIYVVITIKMTAGQKAKVMAALFA